MDNRGIALKNIQSYLVEFSQHVYQQNASGRYDVNKDSEDRAIVLLNAIFGYQLRNANNILSNNYPAIDLVDKHSSITIQVTATSDNKKIIDTIEQFILDNLFNDYKKLCIYIVTEKKNYYRTTIEKINSLINGRFEFEVFDNTDLGNIITNLPNLDQILFIESILELEFGNKNKLIKLTKSDNNSHPKFKFNFKNESTLFLGREHELNELMKFSSSEAGFSWWIISGKAGSGKSRLALEFAKGVAAIGGYSGFITSSQLASFDWEQNHSRPILVIIDYAQSKAVNILNIIVNLSIKNDYRYKFRLLLIEREVEGEWWLGMVNDFYASKSLFNINPLEVAELQDDLLFSIIEKVIADEGVNLILDKTETLYQLSRIDPLKRPLYAMFIGVALAKEQRLVNWNQYNLLDFIIENNLSLAKKTFMNYDDNLIDNHMNLIAVATVCNGLSNFEIKKIFNERMKWLPSVEEFDDELYRYLTDGSTIERDNFMQSVNYPNPGDDEVALSPLLPDILGEYLVLKNLDKKSKFKFRDENKLDQFIKLSESTQYYYYNLFIRRLLQDYPDHSKVADFLIGNKDSIFDNRGTSCHIILETMKYLYRGDIKYLEILINYLRLLTTIVNTNLNQRQTMDYPERAYQEGCQIMVYTNNGNLNEQLKYYNIIKSNTDKFEKNPMISIDPMVGSEDFNPVEARNTMEKMEDPDYAAAYIAKRTVIDARIPHLEVLSIDCILRKENIGENYELAATLLDRLFYLCGKFSDPRMKKECLRTYIEYGTDKIKEFDNKVDLLLTGILNTPPQVHLINVEFEQFLFIEKLVWFKISSNKTSDSLHYYNLFLRFLFRKKGSPSIGNAIINMSLLAERIAKHFYQKGIRVSGDLFYDKIVELYPFLSQFPVLEGEESNSIGEVMRRVSNNRNGYF